jgi:hypothetical protein
MRAKRSSAGRVLMFALVAGGHVCIFLILTHRQFIESRDQADEDESLSMILFPVTDPRAGQRLPVSTAKPVHRVPSRQPIVVPVRPLTAQDKAPPSVPPNKSGNAIDWDFEKQQVAKSMVQPPTNRIFGAHPRSGVEEPHRNQPAHTAGESYRDMYGDTVVWINESCFIVSEAPQLGTPETFKRVQPTRVSCVRQGPLDGELFEDLPEYKKRHPQSSQ